MLLPSKPYTLMKNRLNSRGNRQKIKQSKENTTSAMGDLSHQNAKLTDIIERYQLKLNKVNARLREKQLLPSKKAHKVAHEHPEVVQN